ncbi:MAG TPA: hypothetical protein P5079_06310 [Elusimicrobiota bacterium]|nr:hypothetical protein [Elusimicrobiota bacterium]
MGMMLFGFVILAAVSAFAYFMRRRDDVLRFQAQILSVRFALETLLRRRRELAGTWCSLCEERELMPDHIRRVRQALGRMAEAEQKGGNEFFPAGRLEDEKKLSRLIRETYVHFLEQMPDDAAPRDFFRQYLQSLTRLEKEVSDAQELYNDCALVYNNALAGWVGRLLRRWERWRPRPMISLLEPGAARHGGALRPGAAAAPAAPPIKDVNQ